MNAIETPPFGTAWHRYLLVALLPFGLVCLWRSPLLEALRPFVGFGGSWRGVVMAWGPEGFTFGMLCFFAQRTFKTPARRTLSSITIGFYLVMWLSIWALGVIVPGGMTLSSFSSYLLPLKDTFLLGGLAGGVLAGGMAMVYAIICIIGVTGALLGAAAWAALILPSMTQSATSGRITLALGVGFGWAFGSAIVSGTAFWILRLFIIGMVENALWRGIIDAAATVAIIGIYAQQVALRTPSTDSRSS